MGGAEYGALYHLGSASNFTLQATRNHLNINSGHNGTGLEAFRIVGGNGSNARFIGIGDYSNSKFYEAQNQLQQFITSNANVYHQFTNGNTTGGAATTASEGFKLGLTYNSSSGASDAELISQTSSADMNFYTNTGGGVTKRMTILSSGNVGIGTSTINSKLSLDNNYSVSGSGQGIDVVSSGTGVDLTGLKSVATGTRFHCRTKQ